MADSFTTGWGRSLDGDSDGTAGGDRSDAFFRLYGDSDGDRDVDLLDLGRFLSSFGQRAGSPSFLWYFDVNGDDRVSVIDLIAFLSRLGRTCSRSDVDPGRRVMLVSNAAGGVLTAK